MGQELSCTNQIEHIIYHVTCVSTIRFSTCPVYMSLPWKWREKFFLFFIEGKTTGSNKKGKKNKIKNENTTTRKWKKTVHVFHDEKNFLTSLSLRLNIDFDWLFSFSSITCSSVDCKWAYVTSWDPCIAETSLQYLLPTAPNGTLETSSVLVVESFVLTVERIHWEQRKKIALDRLEKLHLTWLTVLGHFFIFLSIVTLEKVTTDDHYKEDKERKKDAVKSVPIWGTTKKISHFSRYKVKVKLPVANFVVLFFIFQLYHTQKIEEKKM